MKKMVLSWQQLRIVLLLIAASIVLFIMGLAAGSEGLRFQDLYTLSGFTNHDLNIVTDIRAPRTLAAWLVGGLLGLGGAIAQGVFRNPLADPYLLGAGSGASLGVVLILAAGALGGQFGGQFSGQGIGLATADVLARLSLVSAAFLGAFLAVILTMVLAGGTRSSTMLLLAGVVVGVVLSALSDMVTFVAPEALRGKQAFLLGSTAFVGWAGNAMLCAVLASVLPLVWSLSRGLDALVLGEDTARSLGLHTSRMRLLLVTALALVTGTAVALAGLVGFVGLLAPHVVRRLGATTHGFLLVCSTLVGAVLLLASDILARVIIAPQELPVGILTAIIGGTYFLVLLRRRLAGSTL
jgi:iron complex transport system permease protein